MKILPFLLIGAMALCVPQAHGESAITSQLSAQDLATADGSCRVGLHADNLYCILTAEETRIKLDPDKWSTEVESNNWTSWLSDFDNDLYSRWLKNASANGQETVVVLIVNGTITVTNGTFLQPGPGSAEQRSEFETTIQSTLEQTLRAAAPMPQTKNKLKEIRTTLTFMRDPKVVPRYGKNEFGFAAVKGTDGNVVVYGRTKEGRSPGIQIISDRDGGSIQVTDMESFIQKCAEIEKTQ